MDHVAIAWMLNEHDDTRVVHQRRSVYASVSRHEVMTVMILTIVWHLALGTRAFEWQRPQQLLPFTTAVHASLLPLLWSSFFFLHFLLFFSFSLSRPPCLVFILSTRALYSTWLPHLSTFPSCSSSLLHSLSVFLILILSLFPRYHSLTVPLSCPRLSSYS